MRVGDVCSRRVVTIERTESLLEAARRMRTHHVGCVVVVEPGDGASKPIGILTDRDIVVSVLATASPYLDALQVGDVSTAPLVTALEGQNVGDVLKTMRTHGIRRLPIVDGAGALVGLLAFDDLLEVVADELHDLAALVAREQRHETDRRV